MRIISSLLSYYFEDFIELELVFKYLSVFNCLFCIYSKFNVNEEMPQSQLLSGKKEKKTVHVDRVYSNFVGKSLSLPTTLWKSEYIRKFASCSYFVLFTENFINQVVIKY